MKAVGVPPKKRIVKSKLQARAVCSIAQRREEAPRYDSEPRTSLYRFVVDGIC